MTKNYTDSVMTPGAVTRDYGSVVEDPGDGPEPYMVRPLMLRVWGPRGCFARPEFPTERVSYPCMTPSAARGILSAIYYKPEFNWQVRQVRILNPIKRFNETRNELQSYATKENLKGPYRAEDDRLQRHTLGLADLDYVIVAEAVPVPYTVEGVIKHAEIFEKMASKGQCCRRPYFGAREWALDFRLADGTETPHPIDLDVGPMTFDFNYLSPPPGGMDFLTAARLYSLRTIPIRFRAKIVKGVLDVPAGLYKYGGASRGSDRRQPLLHPGADI